MMFKLIAAGALCALTLVAAGSPAHAKDSVAASAATVQGFVDTVFNQHKVAEGFDRFVGPTYTQHNPKVPDGREGGVKGLTWLVTNNPGLKISVKRTIAQGDLVAIHYNMTMKDGDRGQAIVDIFRLKDGKIVEHWDVVEDVPAEVKNTNGMF